ncbi:ATP-dependent translocase ABCB1-like [Bufo gargarizans]|uniref:ATP-dependent translocase ABCB1-like n=1 Tax=Bufo gargarizans TaxID=30331 RepID=UPI001CF4A5AD|nr:ATP-dependent translocase ABCB1-like [Bufo gargarizans]
MKTLKDDLEKGKPVKDGYSHHKYLTLLKGADRMFQYADKWDILLMVIGIVCAFGSGTAAPLSTVIFGQVVGSLSTSESSINGLQAAQGISFLPVPMDSWLPGKAYFQIRRTTIWPLVLAEDASNRLDTNYSVQHFSYTYLVLGSITLVLSVIQIWTFIVSGTRQIMRIRQKFFNTILHQDMAWFDSYEIGTLNSRLMEDMNTIYDGLSINVCIFGQFLTTVVTGITIGFVKGWKLTLVILAAGLLPFILVSLWTKIAASFTSKELKAYSKADAVAEEILTSIRTVASFNGQEKAMDKYNANLIVAKNVGIKKSIILNLAIGVSEISIFGIYAIIFWYAEHLIAQEPENYNAGNVITILFSVLLGTVTMGRVLPNMERISNARGAAFEIYKIINKARHIDSGSTEGYKPDKLMGNMEFKNINFAYPSRPDIQVLKGLNLRVPAGKTTALVGISGCGKSTTIQLLQRFYDPTEGEITLDGHDIRSLNVKWLRDNIGLIGQEPVLFGTTISENIRFGRDEVTDEEIEQAAREANAYDFISRLPDKFNTMVGERGGQLSGGQKQRIAIARALVRHPKILLLDEATSALDGQSEAILQAALDKARAGRTTIVIAQRLSTIRTADTIAVFHGGVVVEQGTHSELMKKEGVYHSLVMLQVMDLNQGKDRDAENQSSDKSLENENSGLCDMGEKNYIEDTWPTLQDVENMLAPIKNKIFQNESVRRKSEEELSEIKSCKENTGITDEECERLSVAPLIRILRINKSQWIYILIGMIAAVGNGCMHAAYATTIPRLIHTFSEQDPIKRTLEAKWVIQLFMIQGFIIFTGHVIMGVMFGKSGENLIMRLKSLSFKALLRQEMAYFDNHENAVGALLTRHSMDTSEIKKITGSQLGLLTMTLATLLATVIICFVLAWQLMLLILAFIPFLAGIMIIEQRSIASHASKTHKALQEAGRISTEVVENIRTVVSLTREDVFYQKYNAILSEPHRNALWKAPIHGLGYGIDEVLIFFLTAALFSFGAWLIGLCYIQTQNVYRIFFVIMFAVSKLARQDSLTLNFGRAKLSAERIFQLLDRTPAIDIVSEQGETLKQMEGNLEFKNIQFVYPTRPNLQILHGFNLKVSKGQTLALVGSSGCGKSTVVQLLERFYDPAEGQVLVDGIDITSLHLKWLRSQLAIVSQEPILFDCSIEENIQYGDNSRLVPEEEVIEAAKAANIHTFIMNLPEGYNTRVGDKGAQLSGGQKQRIAIARALVRKPKVLLLDEATSALDYENEKIVQQALDSARQGRTCIVIAHRLSTIQNADNIAVIKNGKVVEYGTHDQLLANQADYYALVNAHDSDN